MKAAAPGKRKAPEESTVWDPSSKSPKPDSNGGSADDPQISGANALAVVDPSAIGGAMVPSGNLKGKVSRGGSKYKGVYRDKNVSGKYKCSIRRAEREVHLGYYGSEEEAARAYDKAHWCCKSSTKNFDISTYDAEEMAKIKEMPSNDLTELRRHLGVGLSKEGKEGSSKYRGVCKEKKTQKWRAEIQRTVVPPKVDPGKPSVANTPRPRPKVGGASEPYGRARVGFTATNGEQPIRQGFDCLRAGRARGVLACARR